MVGDAADGEKRRGKPRKDQSKEKDDGDKREEELCRSAGIEWQLAHIAEEPAFEGACQSGQKATSSTVIQELECFPESDLAFGERRPICLIEVDSMVNTCGIGTHQLRARE